MISKKISKPYRASTLVSVLREARLRKGWSQRELGVRAHMPQAQISRIESGEADPQVSTLLELARSLDLELQLVPRSALNAVDAVLRSAESRADERVARDLATRLLEVAHKAHQAFPERKDVAAIDATLREVEPYLFAMREPTQLDQVRGIIQSLEMLLNYPPAERPRHAKPYADAAAWLKSVRNQLVHSSQDERPAYTLDDEE